MEIKREAGLDVENEDDSTSLTSSSSSSLFYESDEEKSEPGADNGVDMDDFDGNDDSTIRKGSKSIDEFGLNRKVFNVTNF